MKESPQNNNNIVWRLETEERKEKNKQTGNKWNSDLMLALDGDQEKLVITHPEVDVTREHNNLCTLQLVLLGIFQFEYRQTSTCHRCYIPKEIR